MDDSHIVKHEARLENIANGVVVDDQEVVVQTLCLPAMIRKHDPITLTHYSSCLKFVVPRHRNKPREKIETLFSNTFSLLSNLTAIKLMKVNLTVIEPGAFKGLQSVRYLNLFGNKLTQLPDNVFQDTPNLISLNLEDNSIDYISVNLFRNLSKLEVLELSKNQLMGLPTGWDCDLRNLKTLTLARNKLFIIRSDMFVSCSELRELNLNATDLILIQNNAFKYLVNLEKLWLLYNGQIDVDLAHEVLSLDSLKQIFLCSDSFETCDYIIAKTFLDEKGVDVIDTSRPNSG